ncbi:ArsR family transcriptional regulator [Ornatilinea apprima]|uniref:ArsR family transcriptional regulator n=1 Tax=Ornatilinea apprima TaxID=1134406 RepID=A0A0P6X7K8_9CHLR|nr:metalloregulator ArsR/SmtB family transcription factor [Ornatilinea apprima]KPL70144.1 ArsR family transcriptional regulator [Ornatilinea apprima]
MDATQELLNFFKALADANRLKIVGLLSQQDLTVEQIAEMLALSPSTVSHHLSRLSKAGLVSARAESYYNIYHLQVNELEAMSKRLLAHEDLPEVTQEIDVDAYDHKVIKSYTNPDGTLKTIPTQLKKLDAILRYVLKGFQPGARYTEKQVNEILQHYNEDYAQLRRELVEQGYMCRQGGGGDYWLPDAPAND